MSDAKAITYEEWCRTGGGLPPPSPEPNLVGKWLRSCASHLIQREKDRIAELRLKDLALYPVLEKSEQHLTHEFQRIATPGLSGAFAATQTIWRLGVCSSGATLIEDSPRP